MFFPLPATTPLHSPLQIHLWYTDGADRHGDTKTHGSVALGLRSCSLYSQTSWNIHCQTDFTAPRSLCSPSLAQPRSPCSGKLKTTTLFCLCIIKTFRLSSSTSSLLEAASLLLCCQASQQTHAGRCGSGVRPCVAPVTAHYINYSVHFCSVIKIPGVFLADN